MIMAMLVLMSAAAHGAKVCEPKIDSTAVEVIEVEAKHLVPDLGLLPFGLSDALKCGRPHDQLPRRGLVLQDHLPVTSANLKDIFAAIDRAGVPFGTAAERRALSAPGAAREIRLMTKSIRIQDRPVTLRQLTIKGAGGVAVDQIESPERLTPAASTALAELFAKFAPRMTTVVRKLYFEIAHPFGHVEVDVFLSPAGVTEAPVFVNGEVEFHGADAVAAAERWRADASARPRYLGRDLTDVPGCKSRDIATAGPPAEITTELAPFQSRNHNFVVEVAREMREWADPDVAARVLGAR